MPNPLIERAADSFANNFTVAALRASIVIVSAIAIWLAFKTDNKIAIAAILAYLVLP